ncbi:MAG: hypothetical protein AAGG80_06495 [Pseudomonadota bacterium]
MLLLDGQEQLRWISSILYSKEPKDIELIGNLKDLINAIKQQSYFKDFNVKMPSGNCIPYGKLKDNFPYDLRYLLDIIQSNPKFWDFFDNFYCQKYKMNNDVGKSFGEFSDEINSLIANMQKVDLNDRCDCTDSFVKINELVNKVFRNNLFKISKLVETIDFNYQIMQDNDWNHSMEYDEPRSQCSELKRKIETMTDNSEQITQTNYHNIYLSAKAIFQKYQEDEQNYLKNTNNSMESSKPQSEEFGRNSKRIKKLFKRLFRPFPSKRVIRNISKKFIPNRDGSYVRLEDEIDAEIEPTRQNIPQIKPIDIEYLKQIGWFNDMSTQCAKEVKDKDEYKFTLPVTT